MARKKQELSRKTLARLEEEMRLYPKITRLKAEALVTAELNRDTDVNWWIQGSRKKSEPPLDELMKKEGNKAYQYYDQLAKDIERTVSGLSPDLQKIIRECLWGMNSYYDWGTIGKIYLEVSVGQSYSVRYKILEKFAIQRGISFKNFFSRGRKKGVVFSPFSVVY